MGNRNLDHKQMLIAKCYELALKELPHVKRFSEIYHSDENLTVDDHAKRYFDKIVDKAQQWGSENEQLLTREQVEDSLSKLTIT